MLLGQRVLRSRLSLADGMWFNPSYNSEPDPWAEVPMTSCETQRAQLNRCAVTAVSGTHQSANPPQGPAGDPAFISGAGLGRVRTHACAFTCDVQGRGKLN
ncbi:hypothetical protein SKAU_G00099450 [Synaphobranchus kaupii]|uniref:Uncharacterized protein n=1 Tax=Synaphobranchus kaupii TaxID=118154 RepID=A0A9Q1J682_SYNKA|nr:hypothetical protein SKAU_G00099450 [Synaphobranchus kaupii]